MELRLVPPLLAQGAQYEPLFLHYPLLRKRHYTPDVVLPNGIALEIKGWFPPADRSKMLAVKEQYPELDLRLVLATPRQTLGRGSRTTLIDWCEKHGFKWADNTVPAAWLAEPVNERSKAILDAAPKHNRRAA